VELQKTLAVVQEVLNDRPLTYVSVKAEDLEPLTPNMFLKPFGNCKFPEGDLTEGEKMRVRHKYMTTLWGELKQRFQREYLSLIVSKTKKKPTRELQVGELVVVGNDIKKRLDWPLGRVLELYPGQDGICRVAKVKLPEGELIRPVQRLHPLELDMETAEEYSMKLRSSDK